LVSKRIFTTWLAAVLVCGLGSACSDGDACLRHSDCVSGESCHSGTCMADKPAKSSPKPDAGSGGTGGSAGNAGSGGEFDGSTVNDSSPE
jgi:hypothetical protein